MPEEFFKDVITENALQAHFALMSLWVEAEARKMQDRSHCQRKANWKNVIAELRAEAAYIEEMIRLDELVDKK